jgi:hypothetical protein
MEPQNPTEAFFFLALLDDLAQMRKRKKQERRSLAAGRTVKRYRVRHRLAFRGGQLLLGWSQWLLRYSEGLPGS